MFRSYWLPIFAIVGIVLWGQPPRAEGVPSPSPTPKEQPEQAASKSGKNPPSVPVIVIETPEQAVTRDAAEKKSQEHDAKDLEAQINAANASDRGATAAEWQIVPTWLGAVLSFVGTCLILWTLLLTRQANQISREIGEAQVRAYLSIETPRLIGDVGLPDGSSRIRGGCNVKNIGNSPAKEFISTAQIIPIGFDFGPISSAVSNKTLLGAQSETGVPVIPDDANKIADWILSNKGKRVQFNIIVTISYRTVFMTKGDPAITITEAFKVETGIIEDRLIGLWFGVSQNA